MEVVEMLFAAAHSVTNKFVSVSLVNESVVLEEDFLNAVGPLRRGLQLTKT